MKKLATLLALALLAAALPVSAQDVNGIGFYFDEAAASNYLASAAPYSPINAYLLATHISQAGGLSGWEAEVVITPAPSFPPTYTVSNNGLNVLTAPIFQVGMATALPNTPAIKLLTVTMLNFGTPFKLSIGPCTPSSFGGLYPGYADGIDPGILVGLTPSCNVPLPGRVNFFTVASFMESAPVATEPGSWSSVKNLYQ
ncbi:MAG: hypothetical protein ACYDIE_12030 [Candidatus Krumholzibacteriia bacterium]